MNQAISLRRDALRRGGFTLIEVVIALAIFLFGALAIVRIFPPALGVIQNNEDRLTAINLNRSTNSYLIQRPAEVPFSIHNADDPAIPDPAYDPANLNRSTSTNFKGAVVGTATRNESLPRQNVQGYEDSALNKFRYITGERHKVLFRNVDPSNGLPNNRVPHILTNFPYEVSDGVRVRIFEEDIVNGVTMNSNGTLNFSEATLESTGLAFRANNDFPPTNYRKVVGAAVPGDTFYYVSYSWIENDRIQSVEDEPIVYAPDGLTPPPIPRTAQGERLLITPTAPSVSLVTGPVRLRLRRLSSLRPFSSVPLDAERQQDSYRGYIELLPFYSPNVAPNPTELFSPQAEEVSDVVSVDYQVRDWRWLVSNQLPTFAPEDLNIPTTTPPQTPRSLIFPIKQLEEVEFPIYTLFTNQEQIQQRDTWESGAVTSINPTYANEAQTPGDPAVTGGLLDVKRKNGQVTFDVSDSTTRETRVVARTLDNWTHQLSVAASSYKPFYANQNSSNISGTTLFNRSQVWRDYAAPDYSAPSVRDIYFHPSEAGKSVRISYSYVNPNPLGGAAPNFSNDIQIKDRILTIDSDIIDTAGLDLPSGFEPSIPTPPNASDPKVARLQLTDRNGDPLTTNLTAIRKLNGASIQSRTAWLDGDKFTQVSTIGMRGDN